MPREDFIVIEQGGSAIGFADQLNEAGAKGYQLVSVNAIKMPHPQAPTILVATMKRTRQTSEPEWGMRREMLAAWCHATWAHWFQHVDDMSAAEVTREGVKLTIPIPLVKKWRRQAKTPYDELSNGEQDSDRKFADQLIAIMRAW